MVHSTISSSEADATQHQIDRLFGMMQQLLGDTMQWVATRNPKQENRDEILRIWMGNGKDGRILRQVYGPLANGETRNDLNPDRLRTLLDAFQEPATVGIEPALYARRKPVIEIKIGNATLFRQERDGVVTVNQIQLQQQAQQESKQRSTNSEQAEAESTPGSGETQSSEETAPKERQNQAEEIAQIARYLMNPLETAQPLLSKAQVQEFTLDFDAETNTLTISKGQKSIVRDRTGQVENLGASTTDWQAFHALAARIAKTPSIQQVQQSTISESNTASGQVAPTSASAQVAARQVAKLSNQPLQRFFGRILQGTAHWLNRSLDHWQRVTIAHSAMQTFGQGHDRTGEEAYQIGDFQVNRQGNQRFEISDREGGLLQFQNLPSGIKFMQMSDRLTQPTINRLVGQLSSMAPQGRHEAEFAFRVREAEQTVRDFLSYMKTSVWDYEQGKFRLEIVDNQVLITSKQDGRGQIHGPEKVMQKNHRAKLVPQPSRLTWKDFDHLDSIRDRLNARIAAEQKQQVAPISLQPVELNRKPHQVSQRSHQNGKGRALE
jgi:hypothetical protein